MVDDLLTELRKGTRRGGGAEVVNNAPPPSTRGTGESSDVVGQRQVQTSAEGRRAHPCLDCRTARACDTDGTCWRAERDRRRTLTAKPPLNVLRRHDGKPNYADAAEMSRFLVESGEHATPATRKAARRPAGWPRGIPWPEPWESWISRQNDPRRANPITWQRWIRDQGLTVDGARQLAPIEQLADAPALGKGRRSMLTPEQLRDLNRQHVEDGVSLTELSRRGWREWGYSTQGAALNRLRNGMRELGLHVRSKQEARELQREQRAAARAREEVAA